MPARLGLVAVCAFGALAQDTSLFQGPGLRPALTEYRADRESLRNRYRVTGSAPAATRFAAFYRDWRTALDAAPFEKLDVHGRVDWLLFRNHLDHQLRLLERTRKNYDEVAHLVPFAASLRALEEDRERFSFAEPEQTAAVLDAANRQIENLRKSLGESGAPPVLALRAAGIVSNLRDTLKRWNTFYDGYDPLFTWWNRDPYQKLDKSLDEYRKFLLEKIAKRGPTTLTGDPIGRAALLEDLAFEMVAYTPEQLIRIAEKEFAWCDAEMLKASRELGFGEDWKKALEHVKNLRLAPGKQPALIRDLDAEAVAYLEKHSLVTVPPLARESWSMRMMTPEQQLINPFFTGGQVISVSYPTAGMSHEQKLMSMRGNNPHFSRATVFHELIPGHHLQRFLGDRHRPDRRVFSTPFLIEGWALYWEMLLWDMGFQAKPEDRVGALFWRMHRCARIIFSLKFHLGEMTAEQAVDFLVDRVGHERENALGEVRRSVEVAGYSPLYQSAYMLGALQFRQLRRELVDSGRMPQRQFHDAILRLGPIPVEMIRASLTQTRLTKDFRAAWQFYPDLGATP